MIRAQQSNAIGYQLLGKYVTLLGLLIRLFTINASETLSTVLTLGPPPAAAAAALMFITRLNRLCSRSAMKEGSKKNLEQQRRQIAVFRHNLSS